MYLPEPVFGHGMLYVALSRVRAFRDIVMLIKKGPNHGQAEEGAYHTKNVVYQEMLTSVDAVSPDNLDYWLGTSSNDREEPEEEWLGGNDHSWLKVDDDEYPVSESDEEDESEDVDMDYRIME